MKETTLNSMRKEHGLSPIAEDIEFTEIEPVKRRKKKIRIKKENAQCGVSENKPYADELVRALDDELENCISKLRNAKYGYEIRTFITEYEELMMKKSDVIVKRFLEDEKYKERQKQEESRTGARDRLLVDMFKIGRVLPKIMKVMEDERLNMAEAEMIPQMLMDRMQRNSELHEKARQFTVHEKLKSIRRDRKP